MAKRMRITLNSGSFACPLEEVARAASAHGFDGIELWARDIGVGLSAQDVGRLMRTYALGISAFQVLRDFEGNEASRLSERLAQAEMLMHDMATIGADTLLVCANTDPRSSGDRKTHVSDLRALADMAAARRLRIAFEPLAWSRWLRRYEDAWACIEEVDHPVLGLTVDSFHWFWSGTPVAFAQKITPHRCFIVQLSDARPESRPAIEVARHHRLFPGEGIWPVGDLARSFHASGFDGFYNLEVFNDAYRALTPDDFAARAARSFHQIFEGQI